jgi:broad specificity phosphatase PhoE
MIAALAPTFDAAALSCAATTVLMVRHAEVHNPQRLFYGRLPAFRLSAWGEQQAEKTAAKLADRPITAVYSSPLIRARQTAARIADHHPGATRLVTELLYEIGTSWQGTPYSQFKAGFSAYENRREPGDESIADIAARMTEFVVRACQRHPGETIVGVSHGDPISILRLTLKGGPLTVAGLRATEFAGLGSIMEITFPPDEDRPHLLTIRP